MDQAEDDTLREPPQDLIDALERGRADIVAGRTKPWSEVRARLLARIEEAEAAQAGRRTR